MSPDERAEIVDLEDLAVRPGTYFNPQTEVVVIVDDSTSIDQDLFDAEAYEGADWVRIADDVPVDEDALAKTLESFQTDFHPDAGRTLPPDALDHDEVDPDAAGDEDELEPDPIPED